MRPPKNTIRFLRWFCREDFVEEIEGDLTEIFEKETVTNPRLAKWKFKWRVFKYLRPEFIKAFRNNRPTISFHMIHHILLVAFRNFLRYKRIFVINLVGLTAGLTSVLLIYLWVQDELSMDQFHENKERLYQVKRHTTGPENTIETHESNSVLLPDALKAELPEVEFVVPFRPGPPATVAIGTDRINATGAFAGKDFFKAFTFPVIQGDINTALEGKYNMAISTDLAQRLFGSVPKCIGKPINWDLQHFGGDFVIAAVFEKSPESSEAFDFLVTHEMFLEKNRMDVNWNSNPIVVNLTLREGTDVIDFGLKLNRLYQSKRQAETDRRADSMFLQRYSEIYLHSRYENGTLSGGRIDYVVLFSIVAIFILAIACINFMNLSTARAQCRMKEIGIKKGMGVQRGSLIFQHLSESVVMSLFALLIAIGGVILLLPEFNLIAGKQLVLAGDWKLLGAAFTIALLTGLIAGSYPALYLSGFKPVEIMKGKFTSSKSERFVRKGLVVFQFVTSIVLIIGVAVVYRQLQFIQSWDLGYHKDNVMLIQRQGELNNRLDSFLDRAKQISGIQAASSIGASVTNNTSSSWGHTWEGQKEGGEEIEFIGAAVNFGLIEALGIEMKAGRSFSEKLGDNNAQVVINETAVKRMGITDPIGKWMELFGGRREIIGVMKDYHFQSLYAGLKPQFMLIGPPHTNTIVLKVATGSEQQTIESIKTLFKEFNPGMPFEFTFLDDEYQALYLSEQRVSKMAQYFACVAVVLSCMGLFGLAAFSAERRMREISIRKVLGCSEGRIMRMLTFEFAFMVIVASVIALPLAWHYSNKWLGTFAYRSTLPFWLFGITAIAVLLISLLTVGAQAVRAARINPAESLKAE
ncbi:MAG TPA: ABC transporter permease [Cyclobacteriaceae bacterium]|nr:ABC transporter permease [Cyclobacteriaceae bacterium]